MGGNAKLLLAFPPAVLTVFPLLPSLAVVTMDGKKLLLVLLLFWL